MKYSKLYHTDVPEESGNTLFAGSLRSNRTGKLEADPPEQNEVPKKDEGWPDQGNWAYFFGFE